MLFRTRRRRLRLLLALHRCRRWHAVFHRRLQCVCVRARASAHRHENKGKCMGEYEMRARARKESETDREKKKTKNTAREEKTARACTFGRGCMIQCMTGMRVPSRTRGIDTHTAPLTGPRPTPMPCHLSTFAKKQKCMHRRTGETWRVG
jgi:hypothetical protein